MKQVTAKLGNMRKPQAFTVYPIGELDTHVTVQSDKSIGRFNRHTGEGMLNSKGSSSKYFVHLLPNMGAVPYQFPAEFVAACLEAAPHKDHDGTVSLTSLVGRK